MNIDIVIVPIYCIIPIHVQIARICSHETALNCLLSASDNSLLGFFHGNVFCAYLLYFLPHVFKQSLFMGKATVWVHWFYFAKLKK